VAVISGGGSGHEPAHVGYVAEGLLTAAVCGDVFASPSVDAVLAAILAVTGEAGCLLVVKNYTGDRLNFGLAAERARALGRRVEMVVVSDDIALPDAEQPRGIAGTILVHKVAGHHAARGDDLKVVAERARTVAGAVRSIGLSLGTCDLPGQPVRSHDSRAELGLGIHGEPGVEKVSVEGAEDAVALLVSRLLAAGLGEGEPLAVLVNNLGSVTPLEMDILTRTVLASPLGERTRLLLGPAQAMTSLNMYGFSLSALPLLPGLEEALSSPVSARAWPQLSEPRRAAVRPVAAEVTHWPFQATANRQTEELLRALCRALVDAESTLNELDAKVGDGDTGTTVAGAARVVLDAVVKPSLPLAEPALLCQALGRLLASSMGGSSGVLLSILLTSAGTRLEDGESVPEALLSGAGTVQEYGGARVGQRTLLDSLVPALQVLADGGSVADAAIAARDGAEATREVSSTTVGRSSYLSTETLSGAMDPGAAAVAVAFEAAAAPAGDPER
jgi:dihydroxyacetone kinase